MKNALFSLMAMSIVSSLAFAQNPHQDMLKQLAPTGGQAQAAVELCDIQDYDIQESKQQQLQMFVGMGGNADEFNRLYNQGYEDTKKQYQNASPTTRQQMCNEFKSFPSTPPISR